MTFQVLTYHGKIPSEDAIQTVVEFIANAFGSHSSDFVSTVVPFELHNMTENLTTSVTGSTAVSFLVAKAQCSPWETI